MSYGFVQQKENSAGAASVGSIASNNFTSPLTGGNLLAWVVNYTAAAAKTVSFTDTVGQGANFVQVGSIFNAGDQEGLLWGYVKNITGGTDSVTVTYSASVTFPAILVSEFSGLDTVNPFQATVAAGNRQSAPGTGTDAITSGNIAVSSQPGMLWGFCSNFTATTLPTAGTGFTPRASVWLFGGGATDSLPEDMRLTSTASVPATFTAVNGTNVYYTMGMVFAEPIVAGTSIMGQASL